jgi:predicted NAD/FAD-dependent oxidoreductase
MRINRHRQRRALIGKAKIECCPAQKMSFLKSWADLVWLRVVMSGVRVLHGHGSESIAIIGAGLAGATAARMLVQNGFAVTVYEKSGGTGGRLSTRRSNYGSFDHGAQYLTAKGDSFREMLYRVMAEGMIDVWTPQGKDRGMVWHVGQPGMSSIVKPILAGIDVRLRARVSAIDASDAGATVTQEDGSQQRFDRIIVTAPAPQTVALVGHLDRAFDAARAVEMAPCWAVMLAYARRLSHLDDMQRGGDDDALAWVARDTSKPGREAFENIVIHAGGEWSREHLDLDRAEIVELLSRELVALAGSEALKPVHADAHRWRHARVDKAAGAPFLQGCGGRVIACGDWCIGGRAEAAFDSGRQAAEHLLCPADA